MILYFFVLSCSFSFFMYDFIDLSAFPFLWCGWLKICQFCFSFQRASFWFHWSFLLLSSAVKPHWPLEPNAPGAPCPVARTPSCGAWQGTQTLTPVWEPLRYNYSPVCESPTQQLLDLIMSWRCPSYLIVVASFFVFGYRVFFLVGSSLFWSRFVKPLVVIWGFLCEEVCWSPFLPSRVLSTISATFRVMAASC